MRKHQQHKQEEEEKEGNAHTHTYKFNQGLFYCGVWQVD